MANASKISIAGVVYDLRDPTKAPNTVVSKTKNGLCPKLPNETTTTKYLRQDGAWVEPPNTTTGTTYIAGSAPANTTFGTNGSIKNVYDDLHNKTYHTITLASGITSAGGSFIQNNRVCCLNIGFKKSTNTSAFGEFTVGTIETATRPSEAVYVNGIASNGARLWGTINTSGVLYLHTTDAFYSGDTVYLNVSWVV